MNYKHIAAMGETAFSGVYIIGMDYTDDTISFQYGYQHSEHGMVYKRKNTREIEYEEYLETDDGHESRAYFMYRGERYYLDDFMVIA